jgi:putative ABC transport system substrate-binding protein
MAADYRGLAVSRRRFVQGASVAGVVTLAGCARLLGQAQPQAERRAATRIGILGAAPAAAGHAAFTQALGELGYVDGQNIALTFRASDDRQERYSELAAELVQLPVDLIVAANTQAALAAKHATTTIPIIIVTGNDPVGVGLVSSVARPGGNVTGLNLFDRQMIGKRLQLLQEAVPEVARVAVVQDPAIPGSVSSWRQAQDAAQVLGIELLHLEVHTPADFESAFDTATRYHSNALLHLSGGFAHRRLVVDLAAKNRLAATYPFKDFTDIGGLMFYGANTLDLWRRAAGYVAKILKGAKPADLPVEQPREFDFVINLKTAQALGLAIPQHVLLQATEVIQ